MQGAYRTEGAMQVDTPNTPSNSYFPHKEFLKFTGPIKLDPLIAKLTEFNSSLPEEKRLESSELSKLGSLISESPSPGSVANLSHLLKCLPTPNTFPLLDLARLAVFNPLVSPELVGNKETLDQLYSCCLQLLDKTAPAPAQLLSLRLLTNLCSTSEGEALLRTYLESLLNRILVQLLPIKDNNKNIEIAAATLLLNLAVSFTTTADPDSLAQLLTPLGLHFMEQTLDWEARFRVLVAIGTILASRDETKEFAKAMDVKESVRGWRILEGPAKVSECA